MPPWEKYAAPTATTAAGPWAKYAPDVTTAAEPKVARPFAEGSIPDRIAQAVPKEVVESAPFRALAGLGGGLVNRATGALQGGAQLLEMGANAVGAENLGEKAGNLAENAATVSRGINETVDKAGTVGKAGEIVGDIGSMALLGPQRLATAAVGEALTRPDETNAGLGQRAVDTGINYVGGKVLEPVIAPAAKYVGKALGIKGGEQLTSSDLGKMAGEAYKRADDVGGSLTPKVTDAFLDEAATLRPQTEAGKLISGESAATKLAERVEGLRGKPISLREAQEIDEHLGDVVDGLLENGRVTKEAKKVLDLQSAFRRTIEKASPNDVAGGKAGFEAIKEGRGLWAKAAQLRDVEKIITRAELTDNPASSIRAGFRTIVSNPARLRGYSPEVQKAMKSAAQTGVIGDTLRVFGSRLIPIAGAATGNVGGAIAGQVGSTLAREGATGVQLARANKVADAIIGNTRPQQLGQNVPALAAAQASGLLQSDNTDASGAPVETVDMNGGYMPSITQNLINKEEGRRNRVYVDTTGHKTVGIGFNLDQTNARKIWNDAGITESFDDVYNGKIPLSDSSIDKLDEFMLPKAEKAAKRLVPNFDSLGENQRAALTSLVFQLGEKGLSQFKNTLAYLKDGNYKAVENNLINSKLGKVQAPARTRRQALMLAYDLSHEEADRLLAEQGRIKPNERKYA